MAPRVPLENNKINVIQKEYIGTIAIKETLGNVLGVQMLGKSTWCKKTKQECELLLDKLDNEMIID